MTAALRRLRGSSRARTFAAVFFVVLIAVLFTALRARVALNHLTNAGGDLATARAAIVQRDTATADAALDRAAASLASARRAAVGFPLNLTRPFPLIGSPARAARAVVDAGERGVAASRALRDAVATFPTNPTSSQAGHDLSAMRRASLVSTPKLMQAADNLAAAVASLDGPSGAMLPFVSGRARRVRAEVASARDTAAKAVDALELAVDLADPAKRSRILLVSQDTLELRPTGGFIGSFGVLQIADGIVSLERYASIADLPAADPPLEAPEGLRRALKYPWNLGNTNWWPDFPTSARTAADMFQRQGGGQVDGVIAITELTIKRLIAATGPIKVEGYDIPVSDERFEDRLLYEVELKRPLDNPRKQFLTNLAQAVFARVFALHAGEVTRVADSFGTSASRGDLQMWFVDPARQRLVAQTAVHGALPVPDRDFLLFADSNLSASKANRYVTKHVDYHVTPNDEGGLDAQLRIKVRNFGAQSELNPYYNSHLRVYVPKGSRLTGDGEIEPVPSDAEDGDYTVFSLQYLVKPRASQVIELRYRLPKSVVRNGAYGLTLLRQPGTPRDTYQVRVGDKKVTAPIKTRVTTVETGEPRNRWRDLLNGRSPF